MPAETGEGGFRVSHSESSTTVPAAERAHIVLIIHAPADRAEFVEDVLRVVRNGLTQPYLDAERTMADDFDGPFKLSATDAEIFDAFTHEYCGYDEGEATDDEPHIVQGRRIRAWVRASAIAASEVA